MLKEKCNIYWDTYWKATCNITGKGLFLKNIKTNITDKVSINNRNRRIKVIISRLRIGHVGLANYLIAFLGMQAPQKRLSMILGTAAISTSCAVIYKLSFRAQRVWFFAP